MKKRLFDCILRKFNKDYLYFIIPTEYSKNLKAKIKVRIGKHKFQKKLPKPRIYNSKKGKVKIYIILLPKTLSKIYKKGEEVDISIT